MQGRAKTLDLTAAFYEEGHDPFCPASEVVHFCIEERTSEFKVGRFYFICIRCKRKLFQHYFLNLFKLELSSMLTSPG